MNKIEKLTINGVTYAICDPDAARVQNEAVGENTWSSQKILDTFAPKFTAEGNLVKCRSVGAMTVTAQPSATKIFCTGKNMYNFSQDAAEITGMITSSGVASNIYYGYVLRLPAGQYTCQALANEKLETDYLYGKINSADGRWLQDVVLVQGSRNWVRTVTIEEGDILYVYNPMKNQTLQSVTNQFRNTYRVQIELGNQATEYEPFRGGEFAPGESIPSLPGENVIWADQGPVTVTGWEDPVAKIRQLEAALGG